MAFEISNAEENMQKDLNLLKLCNKENTPLLRFYDWDRPSVTFGVSQKYPEVKSFMGENFDYAKRPSGGGIVLHKDEITYALAVPREHFFAELKAAESYKLIHKKIAEAFSEIGVCATLNETPSCGKNPLCACFTTPALYDVVSEKFGKLAGAAQKRNKDGLLTQGSIKIFALENKISKENFIKILAEKFRKILF